MNEIVPGILSFQSQFHNSEIIFIGLEVFFCNFFLIIASFSNIKFEADLFSKIMPYFCTRLAAMSIHEMQPFPTITIFFFYKIKLIFLIYQGHNHEIF